MRFLKNIFIVICFLSAKIYPYRLKKKLCWYKTKFFTKWISYEFKSFGISSIIYSPIDLVGGKYISIGNNVGIGARTILTAWDKYKKFTYSPRIIIGDNVWISEECHITAINGIEIKNNVLIGKMVTITDNSHGSSDPISLQVEPANRPLVSKGMVIIGEGVWIGDKVTILSGVVIGKNAILGANSVITRDVPENCVVGGIPARMVKQL